VNWINLAYELVVAGSCEEDNESSGSMKDG
jgi:hypothetical protein